MAPVKINKIITATFFMVLVIMSCALTSTLACQGGTECTVETPHCTMDSCNAKCKVEATSRKCSRLTKRTIYASEQEEGEKVKRNSGILDRSVASYHGTLQDQQEYHCYFLHEGGTECTVEEPHCTMDSCREKCKTEATNRKCNRMTASCHKYARPEKCCCYFYPK
uniref:Uncharacterized protein n=1 Tax=Oryza meridionalis TaxID=40149 RepID=A0A0E0F9T4_9ORYZ